MTPLEPSVIVEMCNLIRQHSAPEVHEMVNLLERRLTLDEALISLKARIDGATELLDDNVLDFPGHSVRV